MPARATAATRARATSPANSIARIRGQVVPPLVPVDGPVHVLLVGEAPGPRGADKSGIPFFGDAAGKHLYAALRAVGAIALPDAIDALRWDGAVFADAGIRPLAHGVALTNAYDRCPTEDGHRFRAPTPDELDGVENRTRLLRDIRQLQARGLVGVVTLGRVATRTVQGALDSVPVDGSVNTSVDVPLAVLRRCALPHPSAQGLLSMAPDRGRGARMADLQSQWVTQCIDALVRAGYPWSRT